MPDSDPITFDSLLSSLEDGSLTINEISTNEAELTVKTDSMETIHLDIHFDSDVFTSHDIALEEDQAHFLLNILSNG